MLTRIIARTKSNGTVKVFMVSEVGEVAEMFRFKPEAFKSLDEAKASVGSMGVPTDHLGVSTNYKLKDDDILLRSLDGRVDAASAVDLATARKPEASVKILSRVQDRALRPARSSVPKVEQAPVAEEVAVVTEEVVEKLARNWGGRRVGAGRPAGSKDKQLRKRSE